MQREVKVILVGDSGCGKSSLVFRFCNEYFPGSEEIESSAGNTFASLSVLGEKVNLIMCDMGGGSLHDSLRKLSYEDCDVIIICYSITDKTSLDNVREKWKPEVDQNTTSARPLVLVGTKLDERDLSIGTRNSYDNNVSKGEGQEMENRISAKDFLECSAKTGQRVQKVFQIAAEVGLQFSKTKKNKTCKQS